MRFYYDLEFIENGRTIELISIGIVREDGAEYYAVNADMPVGRIRHHNWLVQNVVPSLPTIPVGVLPTQPWQLDVDHPDVKSRALIADEVREFLFSAGPVIELWAYYGAYDHVALCQLWGTMMDLPKGLPMFSFDLKQEMRRIGRSEYLPKMLPFLDHNALMDALHNKAIGETLMALDIYDREELLRFTADRAARETLNAVSKPNSTRGVYREPTYELNASQRLELLHRNLAYALRYNSGPIPPTHTLLDEVRELRAKTHNLGL